MDALAIKELSVTDPSTTTSDTVPAAEVAELESDEDLKFLRLSFPAQSLVTLKFVLQKSERDVLRAVDELLNRETLEHEQQLNAIVDGESHSRHAIDAFFDETGLLTRKDRKHRKRMRQQQNGATLADAIAEDAALPKLSKWEQINRDVDWLCRVLSVDRSLAQSACHRNTHLGAALHDLLESTTNKRNDGNAQHPDREANEAMLMKSYRALGTLTINQLLDATHDDLPLATEAAKVLASWRPYDLVASAPLPSKTSQSAASRAAVASILASNSAQPSATATAAEYRALAHEHALKRDAYYAQASKAHGEKKASLTGVALHYAERGREQDIKMRMYQMKAARAQAQATLSTNQPTSAGQDPVSEVDLHGLTVQQAVEVAREQATQWWTRVRLAEDRTTAQRSLRLITGKGLHSAAGQSKIYPAVKSMLEREGWRVEVGSGVLIVRGVVRH
jgi:hypothetical protein